MVHTALDTRGRHPNWDNSYIFKNMRDPFRITLWMDGCPKTNQVISILSVILFSLPIHAAVLHHTSSTLSSMGTLFFFVMSRESSVSVLHVFAARYSSLTGLALFNVFSRFFSFLGLIWSLAGSAGPN